MFGCVAITAVVAVQSTAAAAKSADTNAGGSGSPVTPAHTLPAPSARNIEPDGKAAKAGVGATTAHGCSFVKAHLATYRAAGQRAVSCLGPRHTPTPAELHRIKMHEASRASTITPAVTYQLNCEHDAVVNTWYYGRE
jgi:hypothetical protein